MEYRKGAILNCAKKHGLSERDIEKAIRYAYAIRYRNFDPPAHIAFAGPDGKGQSDRNTCCGAKRWNPCCLPCDGFNQKNGCRIGFGVGGRRWIIH